LHAVQDVRTVAFGFTEKVLLPIVIWSYCLRTVISVFKVQAKVIKKQGETLEFELVAGSCRN
jgi:hypothetical protein